MLHVALHSLSWKQSVKSNCVASNYGSYTSLQLPIHVRDRFALSPLHFLSLLFVMFLSLVSYQIDIFISAPQHFLTWHNARSVFLQVLRNTLQLAVTNLVLDVSSQSSYPQLFTIPAALSPQLSTLQLSLTAAVTIAALAAVCSPSPPDPFCCPSPQLIPPTCCLLPTAILQSRDSHVTLCISFFVTTGC